MRPFLFNPAVALLRSLASLARAVLRLQATVIETDSSMPDESQDKRPIGLPRVRLVTDGACRGNPGPGGWACILKHPASGAERELSGGLLETTNNQMELQALISGLEALSTRSEIEVVTDSEYVAKGCTQWMPGWKANNWRRREGRKFKPVKNEEYWRKLDGLLQQHAVRFTVVRGHSGHPENERCDELAVEAAVRIQNGLDGG